MWMKKKFSQLSKRVYVNDMFVRKCKNSVELQFAIQILSKGWSSNDSKTKPFLIFNKY